VTAAIVVGLVALTRASAFCRVCRRRDGHAIVPPYVRARIVAGLRASRADLTRLAAEVVEYRGLGRRARRARRSGG